MNSMADPSNASMLFCSACTKVKGLAPKEGKAPASDDSPAEVCHAFWMRFYKWKDCRISLKRFTKLIKLMLVPKKNVEHLF